MHRNYFKLIVLFFALLVSCTETGLQGTLNENIPPTTSLTVDRIDRDESNRLTSQIKITWWGDDPDGYIIGFEYNINESGDWQFTTKTDSTFLLPIPLGSETADVTFTVRAIDNLNLRDPVGASVVFPIKNSDPVIEFNVLELPPDTTYQLFSFGWSVDDPDGFANLDYVEIALNDTVNSWVRLPVDIQFITVKLADRTGLNKQGEIFVGRSFQPLGQTIGPVELDSTNIVYVRAFDSAGATSERAEYSWYVKRQTSKVLMLLDDPRPGFDGVLNQHKQWLENAGLAPVDIIRINDGTTFAGFKVPMSSAFHRTVDPTLNRALAQWDHIYWISNDMDRNITYALEISVEFFRNNGTMFVTLPSKNLPSTDPLFNFLPVERLGTIPPTANSFRLANNSLVTPNPVFNDLPELRTKRIVTGIFPLVIPGGAVRVYEGNYTGFGVFGNVTYEGDKTAAVQKEDGSLIYFALDLVNDLNDSNGDVGEMVRELLVNRLGFNVE